MWPFKKQVVSDEVKALAQDIEDNYQNWIMDDGYYLVNKTNNVSIKYYGTVHYGDLEMKSTIYGIYTRAEKKHLKISIDKCITKNAISKE